VSKAGYGPACDTPKAVQYKSEYNEIEKKMTWSEGGMHGRKTTGRKVEDLSA